MARTISLFESATSRGARVMRQGEIVQVVYDGGGAMVMDTMEFMAAQKWAQSKPSSGNLLTDRGRFLERIAVLISRPGSIQATRGHEKQVLKLAMLMKQGGYDINEWSLPPELRNLRPGSQEPAMAPKPKAEPAPGPQAPAAPLPDMDDPYAGMKK